MHRQANPTAHRHPMHQSQNGFWKIMKRDIHPILDRKKGARLGTIQSAACRQHPDIPTGTKPPRALGVINHHQVHAIINRPFRERLQNVCTHLRIQCVQRLRPVQCQPPDHTLGACLYICTHQCNSINLIKTNT